MIRRGNLFSTYADWEATQGQLFDGEPEYDQAPGNLSCEQCGAGLVQTPSGYVCCPNGHGKLLPVQDEAEYDQAFESGRWFEDIDSAA